MTTETRTPVTEEEVRKAWYAYRAAEKAAMWMGRGTPLRVVRGRKVPIGTTGTLIWLGDGKWGMRVGLVDAAGTAHFTALGNVAVDVPGDTAAEVFELHETWRALAAEYEAATLAATALPAAA